MQSLFAAAARVGPGKALAITVIECVETADAGFFNEYPASLLAALKRTGK